MTLLRLGFGSSFRMNAVCPIARLGTIRILRPNSRQADWKGPSELLGFLCALWIFSVSSVVSFSLFFLRFSVLFPCQHHHQPRHFFRFHCGAVHHYGICRAHQRRRRTLLIAPVALANLFERARQVDRIALLLMLAPAALALALPATP